MKTLAATIVLTSTLFAVLPASAAEHVVDQIKEKFDKDTLSIKVGDSVAFTNSDPVKHNLTVVTPDEDSKDLGMEQPGTKVAYAPPKAGTYDVRCSIHPKMKMKIKVE